MDLVPSAVEETLRSRALSSVPLFAITTKACTIAGKQFNEGEQISALIGSANRDPEKFDDADRFDITPHA